MPCISVKEKSEGCVGRRQPHFTTSAAWLKTTAFTGQPRSSLMDSAGPLPAFLLACVCEEPHPDLAHPAGAGPAGSSLGSCRGWAESSAQGAQSETQNLKKQKHTLLSLQDPVGVGNQQPAGPSQKAWGVRKRASPVLQLKKLAPRNPSRHSERRWNRVSKPPHLWMSVHSVFIKIVQP